MTFKRTQCCALYWAFIWLHADAGLYLAVCLILTSYIKQHSNSKKTRLSESRRCLLWWSPNRTHWAAFKNCRWFYFRLQIKKHLSAVRGATENNFCETETDVCSGYRTWGDMSSRCIFTSFQFFHFLKWDFTESRQHRRTPCYTL